MPGFFRFVLGVNAEDWIVLNKIIWAKPISSSALGSGESYLPITSGSNVASVFPIVNIDWSILPGRWRYRFKPKEKPNHDSQSGRKNGRKTNGFVKVKA